MTACAFCRLYLLRDEMENLISRDTKGRARCQNFSTHREVDLNTADRRHTLAQYSIIIYLIDLMLNKNRKNAISANCIQKHK